jgi:HEAT repeat protein
MAERMHPKDRFADTAGRLGAARTAAWCADLLTGAARWDDGKHPSIDLLSNPGSEKFLASRGDDTNDYWARVWAARGLRYVWTPDASPAVVQALRDRAWRVREMAAKVARQRELGEAGDALAGLLTDDTTRVRAAAAAALGAVGEAEHAEAIRAATSDPEASVRVAAARALDELRRRLDRDV